MAIVIRQRCEITCNSSNKKYLQDKGYKWEYLKKIKIKISDLSQGSNAIIDVLCDNCGSIHNRRFVTANRSKNHYCDNCINRRVEKTCETCGKLFKVGRHEMERRKTCSNKCHPQRQSNKIKCNCFTCGKVIYKTQSQLKKSKSGSVFCSNICVGKFNSLKDSRVTKNCTICNKEYKVIPSLAEKSVACSIKCQAEWQSKTLVGENANNYKKEFTKEDRTVECEWCKKQFIISSPYKLKKKNNLCSKKCYRKWYSKVWSQRKEWKEQSRIRAVKMLEKGQFNKTETSCQLKVNKLLNELGIKFKNEFNAKYFSIDNFLKEKELFIEVMGTYWHTDPRFYDTIGYKNQLDRITMDKRKNTYIKNKYNVSILYLWEYDIENNIKLCKELIKSYINNNGILDNYHSFNYMLKDNKVILNDDIITPYSEYEIEDLNEIVKIKDPNVKISRKQIDKWITFNCDSCGKEVERLKSKYVKAKNHFCSNKCRRSFSKGK